MRKTKWWWSMFIWSFQVLLYNSFFAYKRKVEVCKLSMQAVISHYEFQKQVALAWIFPHKYWKTTIEVSERANIEIW